MPVQRPILVGGLAISLGLWGLDSVSHVFNDASTVGLVVVAGAGWWWYQRLKPSAQRDASLTPISPEAIAAVLADVETMVQQSLQAAGWASGTSTSGFLTNQQLTNQQLTKWAEQVRSRRDAIQSSVEDRNLNAVALGSAGVGKSTLLARLNANPKLAIQPWQLTVQEAPQLFNPAIADDLASPELTSADVVLYLVAGDLTESDYQVLQALQARQQPFMVVLNKRDQYLPTDLDELLSQIQSRLKNLTALENVVVVAANPNPIKVRRHASNGDVQEWLEAPAPELAALTQRLQARIIQDGQQMRWASALRQAEQLKREAKDQLNQLRRDRAQPIVENYQWISAGAALVNPLPALDLLATAAVNTQMVVELGEVYQQKLSLEHAQTVAGEMAKLLVKLGIAEIASQAIAATLKTNVVTYVAGGTLQGISAAYLTHLAGLSLIDYFQSQEIHSSSGGFSIRTLQDWLPKAFQKHQQTLNLHQFVSQGLRQLMPDRNLELNGTDATAIA